MLQLPAAAIKENPTVINVQYNSYGIDVSLPVDVMGNVSGTPAIQPLLFLF